MLIWRNLPPRTLLGWLKALANARRQDAAAPRRRTVAR